MSVPMVNLEVCLSDLNQWLAEQSLTIRLAVIGIQISG